MEKQEKNYVIHLSEVSFITLGMVQSVIGKFIQKIELLIKLIVYFNP